MPAAPEPLAALAASKLPLADASVALGPLSGVKLPPATLDREAKRQGQRAQRLRPQLDAQAATAPRKPELTLEPYQMILQLDAWSLRERDDWAQSAPLRHHGTEPERWPWGDTGTDFRLDQRGQTAGGRPVISEQGFVLTRPGAGRPAPAEAGRGAAARFGQAASDWTSTTPYST